MRALFCSVDIWSSDLEAWGIAIGIDGTRAPPFWPSPCPFSAVDSRNGRGGATQCLTCGADTDLPVAVRSMERLDVSLQAQSQAYERFSAVTSISIFMRGSARPAEIIMAAGRTSPKYWRSTGQHCSNSAPFGRTYVTRTTSSRLESACRSADSMFFRHCSVCWRRLSDMDMVV